LSIYELEDGLIGLCHACFASCPFDKGWVGSELFLLFPQLSGQSFYSPIFLEELGFCCLKCFMSAKHGQENANQADDEKNNQQSPCGSVDYQPVIHVSF